MAQVKQSSINFCMKIFRQNSAICIYFEIGIEFYTIKTYPIIDTKILISMEKYYTYFVP